MPRDLLSRSLIEIAADLRARRVTARELVEAAIGRHERYGERLHAYHYGRRSRRLWSLRRDAVRRCSRRENETGLRPTRRAELSS